MWVWQSSISAPAGAIVDGKAESDQQQHANWSSYGRTESETFYSPLADINVGNVNQLGLSWFLELPGQRTLEATPLAVNGVLYFSGTYGKAYAVDARTGRQLWEFDPKSGRYRPDIFRFSGSLGGHRGVAYWRNKIFVGAIDGRLFALDSTTGKVVWQVQTFEDSKGRRAISGAPRIFKGMVIIGHNGDPGARGYVTAYDAETGRQRWRFHCVPGEPNKGSESKAMAMAAKTWQGEWWKHGGNGSVWDSIVYDSEFDRIYIATANSIGMFVKTAGDNLFVSSIVALDANTGEYLWHYQETPRGDWDYDSNMPMLLADLTIDRRERKVLLHAPKNGFFYVIDRIDGKLISAEKFAKVTWAERVDLQSGRPIEVPNIRDVWPSYLGAHSWQPMSYNPGTGLVYIPTMKMGMRLGTPELLARIEPDDGTGALLAWDPVNQVKRWEVQHKDSLWNGGTMTTAGNLVFQGTGRGQFVAYGAATGEKLWSFDAGLGIIGAPISYDVEGQQYISVLVGYGGVVGLLGKLVDYGWRFNEQPRRLLTFKLGARERLPATNPPRFVVKAVHDPSFVVDIEKAEAGSKLYGTAWCSFCHGPQLENTGSFAPDLRESALAMNWKAFHSVLRDGLLAQRGMPKYDDLSDDEQYSLFMYIRQRAREAMNASAEHPGSTHTERDVRDTSAQ